MSTDDPRTDSKGYRLTCTVKGPQFEEDNDPIELAWLQGKPQIFLTQTFLEESKNDT